MKLFKLICCLLAITTSMAYAQSQAQNVFTITVDGTRWQEIFAGADSSLLRNALCVKDTGIMLQQYWHKDPAERRRRLLPFFWSVIEQQGQLLGNRQFDNDVNVANLIKFPLHCAGCKR